MRAFGVPDGFVPFFPRGHPDFLYHSVHYVCVIFERKKKSCLVGVVLPARANIDPDQWARFYEIAVRKGADQNR